MLSCGGVCAAAYVQPVAMKQCGCSCNDVAQGKQQQNSPRGDRGSARGPYPSRAPYSRSADWADYDAPVTSGPRGCMPAANGELGKLVRCHQPCMSLPVTVPVLPAQPNVPLPIAQFRLGRSGMPRKNKNSKESRLGQSRGVHGGRVARQAAGRGLQGRLSLEKRACAAAE